MKKYALILLACGLLFTACDDDGDNNAMNVSGTWRAPVTFQTCTPADVCSAAGFTAGTSANAVLVISQGGGNSSQIEGSYTYEGAGISATLDGDVAGNQLQMNGSATNPFGTITVDLNGNVSGNSMSATVNHQISLIDGRSGTVSGSGTFIR